MEKSVKTGEQDQFPKSGGPCEDCSHSVWNSSSRDDMGSCRAAVPTVQLIQVGLDENSRPVMSPISAWPPVRRRQGCGAFFELAASIVKRHRHAS
jgi:hypothetical protein